MITTTTETFETYDSHTRGDSSRVYMARLTPDGIVLCNRTYGRLCTLTFPDGAQLVAYWNWLTTRPDVVQAWADYDGEGRHAIWFDRGSRDRLTFPDIERRKVATAGLFERRSIVSGPGSEG